MMMKMLRAAMPRGFRASAPRLLACMGLAWGLTGAAAWGQTQPGSLGCAIGGYVGSYEPAPDHEPYRVAVRGDYAYVLEYTPGVLSRLVTLDISDPASPVMTSSMVVGEAYGLEIDGERLYFSVEDEHGIHIYDLSDPASPAEEGLILIPMDIDRFEVQGDRLHYLDENGVIRIADIADPGAPAELGRVGAPGGGLRDFAVAGDRIYASRFEPTLEAYDISDPAAPALVATHEHNGAGRAKVIIDQGLLLLHGDSSIISLLRSDPGADELIALPDLHLGELAEGYGHIEGVQAVLRDGLLTIGAERGLVMRISLANPGAPVLLGVTGVLGYIEGMGVGDDGVVLSASGGLGVSIVDMNEAGTVQALGGRWNAYQHIEGFQIFDGLEATIEDGVMYAAIYYEYFDGIDFHQEPTLAAIDVSDPDHPVHLSTYFSGLDTVTRIEAQGSTVFAARDDRGLNDGGLEVLDFSDPTAPTRSLLYRAFPDILDMGLDAGTLWMRVEWNAYALLDVSDVSDIRFIGYYKHHAQDIGGAAFSDGRFYISCLVEHSDGAEVPMVSVIDLADPLRPERLDYPAPMLLGELQAQGGVLYGGDDRGEWLYTTSTDDLSRYGTVRTDYRERLATVVVGERAYATMGEGSLGVYDLSDPANPSLEGVLPGLLSSWTRPVYDDGVMILINENSTQAVALSQGCDGACPADLTGDGVLNFFDVSAFLSALGANDPAADFNGDGSLNFFDVSVFLQQFGRGCP